MLFDCIHITGWLDGWELYVPFQHKKGYIRSWV